MEEINKRAIVSGIGLDAINEEDNENTVKMTVQIVKPGMVAGKPEGGGGDQEAVWVASAEGKSVQDAARNLIRYSGRNLYWSHTQVIVIGDELARQGVGPILDFFDRIPDVRLRVWLMVAKESTAEEILNAKGHLESLLAVELAAMTRVRSETSFASAISLCNFLYFLSHNSRAPVSSVVETYVDSDGENALLITGSAAFRREQLVEFYDEYTTRGVLWVVGDVEGGVVTTDWEEQKEAISTLIIKNRHHMETRIVDGKPEVYLEIHMQGKITEIDNKIVLDDIEQSAKLEQKVSEEIKNEISMAFTRAQEEGLDVFGIGEAIRRQHPKYWKTIESNWESVFSELKYTADVYTHLRRYGTTRSSGVLYKQTD